MRIYIAHSRDYDYINELYLPLKNNSIYQKYEFILPHDNDNYKHDREFYNSIDLVIAEVSYPSTGLGIELGFLYDDKKMIYCIHKSNINVSGSIGVISKNIYRYSNNDDMLNLITSIINDIK